MISIYALILGVFLYFGFEKIKKETGIIIYVVLSIISPVLTLFNSQFEIMKTYLYFNTDISLQVLFVSAFFFTGIYWLTKLVKEEKENFPILKKEGLAFFFILSNLGIAKLLLVLIYSTFKGFNFSDKVQYKIKHLLVLFLSMLVYIGNDLSSQLSVVVFVLVYLKYFTEKISENDHYALLVILSVVQQSKLLGTELTISFGLVTIISLFRYKLSENDYLKIKKMMNGVNLIQVFIKWIGSEKGNSFGLKYNKNNLIEKKKAVKINHSTVRQNEFAFAISFMTFCFVAILAMILEGVWFQL